MYDYLDEQQIVDVILKYLDSSIYNYAVLIDGEWGCGKTHLIAKSIIPAIIKHENEKKTANNEYIDKKAIYISLYGITSESEISKQIFLKAIPKLGANEKTRTFADVGIKILSGVASYFSPTFNQDEILDLFTNLNKDKYILIFDDLERCNMDVNSLLGYINSFVEHGGVKTILVANQDEMGKENALNNIELKYMLALNKDLKFLSPRNSDLLGRKPDNNEPLSVHEMKERAGEIFSENALYNKVKEKLIGQTIFYRPTLAVIIPALLEKLSLPEEVNNIIKDIASDIIDLMLTKQHHNIRTLQASIHYFLMIYNAISSHDIPEAPYTEVFFYTVFSSIKCKSGKSAYKWEDKSEYGHVPFSDDIITFTGLTGFKFIDEIVYYSKFDSTNIFNVITSYVEHQKRSAQVKDNPYRLLDRWWEQSEKDVTVNIDKTMEELQNGTYSYTMYPEIVMKFSGIVAAGFPEEILSKTSLIMTENISKTTDIVVFDFHSSTTSNEDTAKLYRKYLNPLIELAEKATINVSHTEINDILNNEDWGDAFYEYTRNVVYQSRERQFFGLIDTELLARLVAEGSSYNICLLKYGIERSYNFSNLAECYPNDLYNLQLFKKALADMDIQDFDKIKSMNVKSLIDVVEKKINVFTKEE